MRNIFLFIRRYFTFISFPGVAGAGTYGFYSAIINFIGLKVLGVANEMTGWFNSQI